MDNPEPIPFTKTELAAARAAAEHTTPDLGTVRRFIATIRKTFTSSPKAVAKSKTTRTKAKPITEDQMDFF